MDSYITGKTIKELREKNDFTQAQLAEKLNVSDKTISKWETGKGLPDISLIEPLSSVLGVSVIEMMKGKLISNNNINSNMLKSKFYVCPICGNVIHAVGNNLVSCCGITLEPLEAELEDNHHIINVEIIEQEYYITINHEMTKNHYISFIAYLTNNSFELIKLYPEQGIETRFLRKGKGIIMIYCNKDGLYKKILDF